MKAIVRMQFGSHVYGTNLPIRRPSIRDSQPRITIHISRITCDHFPSVCRDL